MHQEKNLFPPGLEPGTFRVLGERDNRYTTETDNGGLNASVLMPGSSF